jgi:MoaA/NifB/PqqE/SkfB family radical SAM enzyme
VGPYAPGAMATRRTLPVLESVRAEATSVTTTGVGHQFEIQLGHLCNNRCLFCSSGQLSAMKVARTVALDPVVEAIVKARASGARRLTFLGGEPTTQRSFLPALEVAVAQGFEEIVIFTNGVMFPVEGFIERVVAMGRFEWRVSIQGGDEAAHVAVTQRTDSFRRIVHGLERLQALGQRVTVNLCVNEASYRSLPQYPDLVARYGVQQLHVDIVRPSSTGDRDADYLRAIMPRYTDMAPSFDAMLTRFARELPGFDVNVGNLPYCVLPAWAERIHHGGEETVTQACDTEGLEVAVDKYAWHASMRRHVPACEGCAFRSRCSGVFGEYLALYGDEEFRAVTAATLRAARDGRRARRRARGLARALQAMGDFEGWSAEAIWEGGRETVLPLRSAAGARLDVVFLRAAQAGQLAVSLDFRLADGGDRRGRAPGRGEQPSPSARTVALVDPRRHACWSGGAVTRSRHPLMARSTKRSAEVLLEGGCELRCALCDCRDRPTPPEEVARVLRLGGARLVVRGGTHDLDRVAPLLQVAGGFGEVVVRTHALAWPRPEEAARLAALGAHTAQVPLFSQHPAVHDRVAGRPDALAQSLVGLRSLAAAGLAVEVEIPILSERLQDLEALVTLAHRAVPSLRAVHFRLPRRAVPVALAPPPWGETAPRLARALALCRRLGIAAALPGRNAVPLCALREFPEALRAHRFDPRVRAPAVDGCEHPALCAGCAARGQCPGVARPYRDAHGDVGLAPYPRRPRALYEQRTDPARVWTEAQRQAARSPRWLVLRLTVNCNQDCIFCSVNETARNAWTDPGVIHRAIARAARRGSTRVNFTGGEPTLSSQLPAYIATARRCGIPEVDLCTNGVLLDTAPKVDRLVRAGLTHAFVSLHAHDEALSRLTTLKENDFRAHRALRRAPARRGGGRHRQPRGEHPQLPLPHPLRGVPPRALRRAGARHVLVHHAAVQGARELPPGATHRRGGPVPQARGVACPGSGAALLRGRAAGHPAVLPGGVPRVVRRRRHPRRGRGGGRLGEAPRAPVRPLPVQPLLHRPLGPLRRPLRAR